MIIKEVLIGKIGVDSGTIMICDPCYVIKDWDEFWPRMPEEYGMIAEKKEEEPLLMVGSTAIGDGMYPVYAKYDENGRLIAYEVKFDE
jgi:hypothetical protein